MKSFTSKIGFLALASVVVFASCDKTEHVYTETSSSTTNNSNSDLDAVYDRTVNYSVVVTGQKESDFRSPSGVDGAVVVVSVDGSNVSVTTGADGIATFSGIKAGLASVSISKADWTSASLIVDLTGTGVNGTGGDIDNHTERSAATLVTLMQIKNLGSSTLSGEIEIESDQDGNTDSEVLGSSLATLTARVDFEGGAQFSWGATHTGYGKIVQSYFEGLIGTSNFSIAGSSYSITLPATAYGLPVEVLANPFKLTNEQVGDDELMTFNVGGVFNGLVNPTVIWSSDSKSGETYVRDLFYNRQQ